MDVDQRKCPGCGLSFEPRTSKHKYCTITCRKRADWPAFYQRKKERKPAKEKVVLTRTCEACGTGYPYQVRCGRKPLFCPPCSKAREPYRSMPRACENIEEAVR